MASGETDSVGPLVDRLFRRESARMTAWLIAWLGPSRADLAEDAVQDALVRALKAWSFRGVPANPSAWLWRTARNAAIDRIRRSSREDTTENLPEVPAEAPADGNEDAELELLFLCADPGLPSESSIPLTLKLACGFGDAEIAGALSVNPETIRQRIVRAKRRWRDRPPPTDLSSEDRRERLNAVMNVVYLILNEGYGGHHPDHWQRAELCREAARLAVTLAGHRKVDRRDADALAALCLFQLARIKARTDEDGNIVLLADQDRTLWDRQLVAEGFRWLARAGQGDALSTYHLLAGIASCHVSAGSYASTDWKQVQSYYDALVQLDPGSPFHRMNRAVAIAEGGDPLDALSELHDLRDDKVLGRSYLLPATLAWLLARIERLPEARRELMIAIQRAPSGQLRRRLQTRLDRL